MIELTRFISELEKLDPETYKIVSDNLTDLIEHELRVLLSQADQIVPYDAKVYFWLGQISVLFTLRERLKFRIGYDKSLEVD